jgi:hypothetical protein
MKKYSDKAHKRNNSRTIAMIMTFRIIDLISLRKKLSGSTILRIMDLLLSRSFLIKKNVNIMLTNSGKSWNIYLQTENLKKMIFNLKS